MIEPRFEWQILTQSNDRFCHTLSKTIILILIIISSLQAGGMIDQPSVSVIQISQATHSLNQGKIELYFEDSNPKFPYSEIAYMTVRGDKGSSDNDLVDRMKYEAWKIGSDAVIRTKRSAEDRKIPDFWVKESELEVYKSTVFSGVAIRYIDTANRPIGIDSAITIRIPNSITANAKLESETAAAGLTTVFVGTLTCIGILIYFAVR